MSLSVFQYVLHHSPAKGNEKLVLTILADHANNDGECWPSIPRIAAIANCSDRHVRNALAGLIERNELVRELHGGQGTRSDLRPNLYRILMPHCSCPRGKSGYINHTPGRVSAVDADGEVAS